MAKNKEPAGEIVRFRRVGTMLAMGLLALPFVGAGSRTTAAEEAGPARGESCYERVLVHMGTRFGIQVYTHDRALAEQAVSEVDRLLADLDDRMSDYRSSSELMRLCASAPHEQPVQVSEPLYDVLRRAVEISRASDGAFDVTVGNLTRLWRRARRQHELPSPEALAQARSTVGYKWIVLGDGAPTVRLTHPGMRLDLGGIAKGYAAQKALDYLKGRGLGASLINAGGDLVVGDPPPGETDYRIQVAALRPDGPLTVTLYVHDAAVATSGDLWQFVEIDGRRYSHIVDPRTGLGLTQRSSVTVVARDGATADALASAVSVLGPERGLQLVRQFSAELLMMTLDGDQVRYTRSEGLTKYERER